MRTKLAKRPYLRDRAFWGCSGGKVRRALIGQPAAQVRAPISARLASGDYINTAVATVAPHFPWDFFWSNTTSVGKNVFIILFIQRMYYTYCECVTLNTLQILSNTGSNI